MKQGSPPPVSFQKKTSNRKLAPVTHVTAKSGRQRPVPVKPHCSSTYVSIGSTCPNSCPYKDAGCYVSAMGHLAFTGALERKAIDGEWTGFETIRAEAELINATFPNQIPQDGWNGKGRDLRLHVGGDVSCAPGARKLRLAAAAWVLRGGGAVWTYTHRWREIRREVWGEWISPIASIEKAEDIVKAAAQGYASAITLTSFPSERLFRVPGAESWSVLPCPAETRGKTCVECRLCLDGEKLLKRKQVIGFSLHGRGAKKASKALRVLQGDTFDKVPFKLKAQ